MKQIGHDKDLPWLSDYPQKDWNQLYYDLLRFVPNRGTPLVHHGAPQNRHLAIGNLSFSMIFRHKWCIHPQWAQGILGFTLINMSGWWFEPLWKIWKSVGVIIPNIWKKIIMFQTTNQMFFEEVGRWHMGMDQDLLSHILWVAILVGAVKSHN